MYPTKTNPRSGTFIKVLIDSQAALGVDVDVYVVKGKTPLKYISEIVPILKILSSNKYDIVHAHYMYVGWTALIARLYTTVIVTYLGSDLFGKYSKNNQHQERISSLNRLLHILLCNCLSFLLNHTIVMSKEMANRIKSSKLSVIPLGIDTNVFYPFSSSKKDVGMDETKNNILFAGQKTNPIKRYSLASAAVDIAKKDMPNIDLFVISGIEPPEKLPQIMNAADCLLLTSIHEGSPTIIKEALACNLPIVSVDVGDVRERLKGADNCYIVDAVPETIAEALKNVLLSQRKSKNGRMNVLKLDTMNVAKDIIKLYHSIKK
jgi:glycosyltransferase involved in cell wall biosynthesis